MKNETMITTKELFIGYSHKKKNTVVCADIAISLAKGNLIALVGANGIGKSTLLRTLTNIQKPLSGFVLLDGKSVAEFSTLELSQKMAVVLTEKLPPSNLTVFELVALGRQPYTNWIGKLSAIDIEKINQAITLTQIEPLLQKKHYEISDGQLQIVLIARALAQDTPLIILDEPTTHLDLLHKVNLLKLLKKLTIETNKCILFSTHDIDLAIQLSDQMIIMENQKIIQGEPNDLIEKGIFNQMFDDENIIFDNLKGKFVFKNL